MTENREIPEKPQEGGRYSFGDFTLDTVAVTFLRGEEEVSLPPRVLDLLEYLIERHGQVVAKEELLEQVWEGRFVGEESLTQAISVLRQALGDDPHQQTYIRTVPKRGYAFTAEVVFEGSSVQAAEGRPHNHPRGAAGRTWTWAIAAALITLVGAGVAWLIGRADSGEEEHRVVRLSVNLASSGAGDVGIAESGMPGVPFAISPDGARLVIRGDDGRGSRLYLRDIDGFEMTALPDTEGVRSRPLFSPDGEWILFRREDQLEKISVRGGSSIKLAKVPDEWSRDWGPDGTILMKSSGSRDVYVISSAGGKGQKVPSIDSSDGAQLFPMDLLPDGDSILVMAHTIEPWTFSLKIMSRSTGSRRQLLQTAGFGARYLPNGYIIYGSSDTLFAVPVDERTYEPLGQPTPVLVGVHAQGGYTPWYAVSDTGTLVYLRADLVPTSDLLWVDREGTVTPVPGGRLDFSTVRISADGRQAALTLRDGLERGIWVLDLARGLLRPVTTRGWNSLPNWSPDSKTLTYYALRGDGHGLSRRRADGSGVEQRLLTTTTRPLPRHLSPDGRRLVFWEASRTWQYMDGAVTPLEIEPPGARSLRFSPDGQLIAFEGQENDIYQVFVRRFPEPGQRVQASGGVDGSLGEPGEGRSPNWREDSEELYYSSNGAVFAVEVETEPELRVGPPRKLFEGDYWPDFDVTPDGERFLMRSLGGTSPPRELQVVLNWFDEIEDLVPHPRH